MPGIVLHVGLPKTGTTLLQKGVFPRLGGVHYVGKLGAGHDFTVPGLGAAIDQVYLSDSILSDPAPALSQALAPLRAAARDRTMVISTEALVHPAAQDLGLVAERLARAVPEARILLTLRAQPDLALSWFRSHGRFAQYLFLRKAESEQLPAHLTQRAWWNVSVRRSASVRVLTLT